MAKDGTNHAGPGDYLQAGEEDKLQAALLKATDIGLPKLIQKVSAERFAEKYDGKVIYDINDSKKWFIYGHEQEGVFTAVDDESIKLLVRKDADAEGLDYTSNSLTATTNLIKSGLSGLLC
ncbi:MAG: hypothetical protein WCA35_15605 [Kovacikia sp.]